MAVYFYQVIVSVFIERINFQFCFFDLIIDMMARDFLELHQGINR